MATSPVKALVKNAGWQRVTSWNPQGVFTETNKFFQTRSIERIKIFGNCDRYLSRGILNMSQKMLLFSKYSIKCIISLGRSVIDRIRNKAKNYQFPGFVRSGFLMPPKPPDQIVSLQVNQNEIMRLQKQYGNQIYEKATSEVSTTYYSDTEEEPPSIELTVDQLLTVTQSKLLDILSTKSRPFIRQFLQTAISKKRIIPLSELHLAIKAILEKADDGDELPLLAGAVTEKSPPQPREVRTVLGLITDPKMVLCLHYPKNKTVREYLDILLSTTATVYQDCDRMKHILAFNKFNKAHYFQIYGDKLEEVAKYLGLTDYKKKMGFTDTIVEKLDNIKKQPIREKELQFASCRQATYGNQSEHYTKVLQDYVEARVNEDPQAIVLDAKLKSLEGRKKLTYEEAKIARLRRNAALQGYKGDMDAYIAKNINKLD